MITITAPTTMQDWRPALIPFGGCDVSWIVGFISGAATAGLLLFLWAEWPNWQNDRMWAKIDAAARVQGNGIRAAGLR